MIDEKKLPANLPEFLRFFSQHTRQSSSAHLQRTFARACTASLASNLREKEALTPADKCRYAALNVTGAMSFLNAPPSDPATVLDTTVLQIYARMILGLPVSAELSQLPLAQCKCGFLLRDDPIHHFLSCKVMPQVFIIKRHNQLNVELQKIAQELGITWINERVLANGKRIDSDFNLPQLAKPVGTDWSVVHPASASFCTSQAQSTPGYAAAYRAGRKTLKHDAQVRKEGGVFVPLIVETYGGFHPYVNKLLVEFRKTALLTGQANVPDVATMRNRLMATLIKGNVAIITNGLSKMTRRAAA